MGGECPCNAIQIRNGGAVLQQDAECSDSRVNLTTSLALSRALPPGGVPLFVTASINKLGGEVRHSLWPVKRPPSSSTLGRTSSLSRTSAGVHRHMRQGVIKPTVVVRTPSGANVPPKRRLQH